MIFNIKIKLKDVKFDNGFVLFNVLLKEIGIEKEASIINTCVKREFENIKPWFIKKIGNSINVIATVKMLGKDVVDIQVFSEDILKINEELIEIIKIQRVEKLIKVARSHIDQAVFDNNQIFTILDSGSSNALNLSASEIIDILISRGHAKNIKQLEYLSGNKHTINERLRFTARPYFGFVFKVESKTKQFFLWELLDSHATYIWEGSLIGNDFYEILQEEISFISINGRQGYRKYLIERQQMNFKFYKIEHSNSNLKEEERFQAWKNNIEEIISR